MDRCRNQAGNIASRAIRRLPLPRAGARAGRGCSGLRDFGFRNCRAGPLVQRRRPGGCPVGVPPTAEGEMPSGQPARRRRYVAEALIASSDIVFVDSRMSALPDSAQEATVTETVNTAPKPRMSTRNRLLFFATGWLIVLMPFLFWWNTWFGRQLSDGSWRNIFRTTKGRVTSSTRWCRSANE